MNMKIVEHNVNIHADLMTMILNTSRTNSLLHRAAKAGQINAVFTFLRFKPNVNLLNKSLRTPLHKCYKHLNIVKLLIQNGAKVNLQDNKGFTPAHRAAIKNSIEVIREFILNGADMHIRDNVGKMPFEYIKDPHIYKQLEKLYMWLKSKTPLFIYKYSILNRIPEPIFRLAISYL